MITNTESGTSLDEIADGIYRISTPLTVVPGGFSFNQYLVDDEEPLLFHTGPRRMFPLVSGAIARVLPLETLRWVAFSHFEADECGALNDLLGAAPRSAPVCSRIGAMTSVEDYADRAPRALADGDTLSLGRHEVRWFDAPHVPHGWDCSFLMESKTRTLFCGDLFTQPGNGETALVETDILGPSEAFRGVMDYYSNPNAAGPVLERLAAENPTTLACMHGSAWRGDGAALLRNLGRALTA